MLCGEGFGGCQTQWEREWFVMSAMVREVGEAVRETHFAIPELDLVRVFSRPRKLVSKVTLSPHSCSAELGSGD